MLIFLFSSCLNNWSLKTILNFFKPCQSYSHCMFISILSWYLTLKTRRLKTSICWFMKILCQCLQSPSWTAPVPACPATEWCIPCPWGGFLNWEVLRECWDWLGVAAAREQATQGSGWVTIPGSTYPVFQWLYDNLSWSAPMIWQRKPNILGEVFWKLLDYEYSYKNMGDFFEEVQGEMWKPSLA